MRIQIVTRETKAKHPLQDEAANRSWVLIEDPCDAPMAKGLKLSADMVRKGMSFGSYLPGTVLENEGRRYTVTSAMTLRCGRSEWTISDHGGRIMLRRLKEKRDGNQDADRARGRDDRTEQGRGSGVHPEPTAGAG